MRRPITLSVVASLALCACSTAPRRFEPAALHYSDTTDSYRAHFAECTQAVQPGATTAGDRVGQVAGAGAGVAGGAAVGVGAASAVAAAGAYSGAGVASAAAAAVMLPVAAGAVLGVGLVSGAIRRNKEADLKAQLAECMQGKGHTVQSWKRASR